MRREATRWALLLFLPACFPNPVTLKRQTRFIGEAAEREIGAETKKKLIDAYGELTDPVLREALAVMARRLALAGDRPQLAFEVTVLDTEVVNAFAAPGGYVFVTRGLLERMDREAELAAVLGHEFAHVCALHSVRMIQQQMGYGALTALGAIVSGIKLGPEALVLVAQTADLFTQLYLLGYSREFELEADRVGLRYTHTAGYDPWAALAFFETLRELETRQGEKEWEPYLRSHPTTEHRIGVVRDLLGRRGGKAPPPRTDDPYKALKARLPSLPAGERGRFEGALFSHPAGATLRLPADWGWEGSGGLALASFRHHDKTAWGDLRRRTVNPGVDAGALAETVAKERKWKFIQGRQVLYPAGYGYLGQYYGSGVLGGAYRIRAFFTTAGDQGWMLTLAAPPEEFELYLLPFERLLRGFEFR
jgi:predicted Zn-dependent protease